LIMKGWRGLDYDGRWGRVVKDLNVNWKNKI
jgi:hypothetical protein